MFFVKLHFIKFGRLRPSLFNCGTAVSGYIGGSWNPPHLKACVKSVKSDALAKYDFVDDHLIHCYAACELISRCKLGGLITTLGGFVKEIGNIFGSDNAEWRDILNNEAFTSENSSVKINIPLGGFRFIDIELNKAL